LTERKSAAIPRDSFLWSWPKLKLIRLYVFRHTLETSLSRQFLALVLITKLRTIKSNYIKKPKKKPHESDSAAL